MKCHRTVYIFIALLVGVLCTPTAVWAQEREHHETDQALEILSIDSKLIKDKPYSADTSTDTVQTLPDGRISIVRHIVSKFYRDAMGRTRREQTFGNVDPSQPGRWHEVKIFIDDPVGNAALRDGPCRKDRTATTTVAQVP